MYELPHATRDEVRIANPLVRLRRFSAVTASANGAPPHIDLGALIGSISRTADVYRHSHPPVHSAESLRQRHPNATT